MYVYYVQKLKWNIKEPIVWTYWRVDLEGNIIRLIIEEVPRKKVFYIYYF